MSGGGGGAGVVMYSGSISILTGGCVEYCTALWWMVFLVVGFGAVG